MDDLIRFEAKKTPSVFLDQSAGFIELKGSSYMEDTLAFFDPIMEWVYKYVQYPKDTSVNIDLEFFNTSSAKILLIIIKTLSKIQKAGCKLTVNWFYDEDDDEIRDSGYNFSMMSSVKFNLIKKINSITIDGPALKNE
jgi:SiaC family regulatory phosphoprotein